MERGNKQKLFKVDGVARWERWEASRLNQDPRTAFSPAEAPRQKERVQVMFTRLGLLLRQLGEASAEFRRSGALREAAKLEEMFMLNLTDWNILRDRLRA